jgi:hypothetical protein
MKNKLSVLILLILFLAFGKITYSQNRERITFKSGKFSGVDYILITKKSNRKIILSITIDCNHYINGVGRTPFIAKELYDLKGKYLSTSHLIKDTSFFKKMNYQIEQKIQDIEFNKLTDEEYKLINMAFAKYPDLKKKYSLVADSLLSYLGWYKMPN